MVRHPIAIDLDRRSSDPDRLLDGDIFQRIVEHDGQSKRRRVTSRQERDVADSKRDRNAKTATHARRIVHFAVDDRIVVNDLAHRDQLTVGLDSVLKILGWHRSFLRVEGGGGYTLTGGDTLYHRTPGS